jgi:peptidoglycan hydrolase-like protein with peptidoglycan-binding domain
MKQPDSNADWAISGAPQDCGFANCKAFNFLGFNANSPNWFPANNVPPDPVNWYEDPVFESNLCYFAPRGEGDDWIAGNMGCHSPRLDLDNISCSVTATDPQSPSFCAPENINVDFPPKDQWMRVMVHRYSHSASQTTTPTVKIFCDGALAAELGPQGYATQPTFNQSSNNDVWLVADVLFHEDECISQCIVQPLFQAPGENPVLITETQAESTNGPPYAQNPFL